MEIGCNRNVEQPAPNPAEVFANDMNQQYFTVQRPTVSLALNVQAARSHRPDFTFTSDPLALAVDAVATSTKAAAEQAIRRMSLTLKVWPVFGVHSRTLAQPTAVALDDHV
jgi:hypothetical protein